MKEEIIREIELPAGIQAILSGSTLTIKGAKGGTEKEFRHPKIKLTQEGHKLIFRVPKGTKREKTVIGSFAAHVRNMVRGAHELHIYRLKICSGHFPMAVSVSGKEFLVKNYLGESVPRRVPLVEGADIKVEGTEVIVSSTNKEIAGQMAARIESMCRITNRDIRIFQDGIYIINKAGKEL